MLLFAALFALAIPATIPLWQSDFLFTADSPLHLWRVFELDRALGQGVFYPRWAPDLYFGYSYPLFNFYPPLAYYFVESLHILGVGIANAIKIEFAVCILLAAGGMFLFARDFYRKAPGDGWKRDAAALVSAAAYAYSPYFLLDIYTRGAIAEVLGMALLPFYLWSLRRVVMNPTLACALTAGAIGAAFLLSHNLTAFFSAPVIAGFLVVQFVTGRSHGHEGNTRRSTDRHFRVPGLLALSLGLTLAASAFYWLPATSELGLVLIGQSELRQKELLTTMGEHLQTVANVVQLRWFYEYPEGPFPLGLGSLVIGLIGFGCAFKWLKPRERVEPVYWVLVALLAAFLLTRASTGFWLTFPSLWVIQFAWRLTVFIALAVALWAGAWVLAADKLPQRFHPTAIVTALVIVNLLAIGMVNLSAVPWQTLMPASSEIAVLARYEANVRAGLGSMDEYLPMWARVTPKPFSSGRAENLPPAPPSIPEIRIQSVSANEWQVGTNASEAFALRWRAFYYPDLRARVDGQPAPLRAGTGLGLVTLDVPAGAHQIDLVRGSLPAREIGFLLTALALLGILGWTVLALYQRIPDRKLPAGIVAALALVFLFPQVRALSSSAPPYVPVRVDVDDSLRIVALRTDALADKIKVSLVWQVKQALEEETPVRLELADAAGKVQSARTQYSRYSTGGMREWFPNELVQDEYELFLPAGLVRGEYQLKLARQDSAPVTIATLPLQGTESETPLSQQNKYPVDAQLGDTISLLDFTPPSPQDLRPNQSIPLTLLWRADRDVLEDYSIFVQLLDKDGTLVAQHDSVPNNGFTPTILWRPGAVIGTRHLLRLPANLSPGEYRLIAGLYRFRDLSRLPVSTRAGPTDEDFVLLTRLRVSADRVFTPEQRVLYKLGPNIQLRGFTVTGRDENDSIRSRAQNGSPPRLMTTARGFLQSDIEWSAERAPAQPYKVYAHLVKADGQVVRQQDSPPLNGNYPTTLWETGERIVDSYRLPLNDLPAGEYTLYLGMYDPETGERLPAVASDGTELPSRQIELARVTITP